MSIPLPLISYISAILARLSYFDNDKFLLKYNDIFSIPELKKQIEPLKKTNEENIFNIELKNISEITKQINTFLLGISKTENKNQNENNNNNDLQESKNLLADSKV